MLSRDQVKYFVERTKARFAQIDREQYDPVRCCNTMTDTEIWEKAAKEAVGGSWSEIIRVLSQGESYYDAKY